MVTLVLGQQRNSRATAAKDRLRDTAPPHSNGSISISSWKPQSVCMVNMVRYTDLAGRLPAFAGMNLQSRLPDHYYKYLMELRQPGERVHEIPDPAEILDYKIVDKESLRVKRVLDTPLNILRPEVADRGIWGGEGIVKGFYKYRTFYGQYSPRLFMPLLLNSQVYSEVLDVFLKVQVNERALALFDAAMGFDNYILRTRMRDLKSGLALKLRRKMLLSLAKEDYYPNDPEKHAYIKAKYADCVIPAEEADWIGLTVEEALEKVKLQEAAANPILPLKFRYRKELVQMLQQRKDQGLLHASPPKHETRTYLQLMFRRMTGKKDS